MPAGGAGTGGVGGLTAQLASIPTMRANPRNRNTPVMTLLILEALGALLLFVLMIWWTMFSGRKKGELPPRESSEDQEERPSDRQT